MPTRPSVVKMADALTPAVTLYGKAGCHLCEEALEVLTQLRDSGLVFEVLEIDIEGDDALHLAYLERIPVIEVDGVEVGELEFDLGVLKAAIEDAATIAPNDDSE